MLPILGREVRFHYRGDALFSQWIFVLARVDEAAMICMSYHFSVVIAETFNFQDFTNEIFAVEGGHQLSPWNSPTHKIPLTASQLIISNAWLCT